jgi:hypothetical protein
MTMDWVRSAAGCGLALLLGCGSRAALMRDESHRLDEGLKADSFSSDAANGTYLSGAPPLAPTSTAKGYTLESTPPRNKAAHRGRGSRRTQTRRDDSAESASATNRK